MQIHVGSKHLVADVAVALDVAGREHLVIVAKATWSIPEPGQRPRPLKPQPLVMADEFYGEPGESPLRYGSDFARFKPQCDVIFDACAHAPDGKPVKQMDVEVQVGSMKKQVRVTGPRRWFRTLGLCQLSSPEPFVSMHLHYGLAYGGTRWYDKGSDRLCEAHLANPAGLGFAGRKTISQINNEPAPCLEDPKRRVKAPDGMHQPHALSAIARHWSPRRELAGTYDEKWQEEVFPLLPADFDDGYNQVAPLDQRIAYPRGGERVSLSGVVPGISDLRFVLPSLNRRLRVLRRDMTIETPSLNVDTLFFETAALRLSAVWRAHLPIRKHINEFDSLAIGDSDPAHWPKAKVDRVGGCGGCGGASNGFEEVRSA